MDGLRAEWERARAGERRFVRVDAPVEGYAPEAALVLRGRAHEEPRAPWEPIPWSGVAEPSLRDPLGARHRLFERIAASFARERPVLLVLEDLHWIDAPTKQLLRQILDGEPAPLLVVSAPAPPALPAPDPTRRRALHRERARALPADRVFERAYHLWEAGMASPETSMAAGERAMAALAYELAARHFTRALELASDPYDALLARGEALRCAGDPEAAREDCDAAAALATDPRDRARAALGLKAPVSDDELRVRLLIRQGADAVGLARAAGDPAVLADALLARHAALRDLEERRGLVDELLAVAPDRERALEARRCRVRDLLEADEFAEAERWIDEYAELADRLALPGFQWWAPLWRAMLAVARGRADEVQALARQAERLAEPSRDRAAKLALAWFSQRQAR